MSGAHDFDFLLGEPWNIHNRRRTNALEHDREGIWEEFEAHHIGVGKYLDGRTVIDLFEGGTFPGGEIRKGMTLRAFDEQTQLWSLMWLDNHNPPDFRPLLGRFDDGLGVFSQVIETPDGLPLHMRFTWDEITSYTARWQQAFSFDGGKNWETNWVMEFTRQQ